MKLICNEKTITFDNLINVEVLIDNINMLLGDQYYYSHMIVDGEEIYESPAESLLDLQGIERIEVVALTEDELIQDTILSTEKYLTGAIPEISTLVDSFYNNPNSDSWLNFDDLLEGLQWINNMVSSIDKMKSKPEEWGQYVIQVAKLENEFGSLELAIKNEDVVLIADILQYEILPILVAIKTDLAKLIDTKGMRTDVN